MKRIVLSICAITIACTTPVLAQPKLVQKVTKKGNEVTIPFERYVLPNGLNVVIHEDHSDPIVRVDVTYHVGSAREEIGKSGFAHFFEHMMFQGSDNVADEQHFKIITEAGGTLNGTTNRDRTNYFETVPSNQLEKMLWLEADRMGFLLDAVTQKKFEVQRATVKNERGQRYDNVPYGLVQEVTAKNLYPYGHPYSWLTIGYIEDLNAVNVNDLKNFFMRWYGPNNAVVTVGGDVNTKEVLDLVVKYFGSIPKGPEVVPVKVPAVVLEKDRYVSMMDNYAKLPQLRVVFPAVPEYDKDEAPLHCLAEILGQGKNSILYKNFVKAQKAINAASYNSTTELSGEFVFTVTPMPGLKLTDMEKIIRESIAEFEKRGATDEDIEKFRNSVEANMINDLETVSGKVSQLAAYYTFTGDPDQTAKDLKRYTSVTKADVMRVFDKYIKGKHSLIVSVLTKGQETNKAAEDNYTVAKDGYKRPDYGYAGLKYVKAKDNFDRSKMPGNGAAPIVKVPEFWKEQLPGNVSVIGTKSDEIPVVTILMHFPGGRMVEVNAPSKAGLANLFTDMMDEDTKNYSAEAFSVALDKLGSSMNVYTTYDGTEVSIHTLRKNLDKTLALVEERLLRPKFTDDAFNTNKKRNIESIKNNATRPEYIAGNVYSKLLYGGNNVLGWPVNGTETTLNNIKLEDIQHYYDNYFTRESARIVVVGDISKNDVLSKFRFLDQMPAKAIPAVQVGAIAKPEKTKIYFVNVPNAAQTQFRIGAVTNVRYDALGLFYKLTLINYPFGGAFNSRLNLDLREDKGWTYGARSYFNGDKYTGSYTFSAGIKGNATDSAMRDIMQIWKDFAKGGPDDKELSFTKSAIAQGDALKYEAGSQKAGFLSRMMEFDLPSDYPSQQNTILKDMNLTEMQQIIGKAMPTMDNVYILLVGDKAKAWDGVKKLGYEVVELDKDGNEVKTQ